MCVQPVSPFNTLPYDLYPEIFQYLEPEEICLVARVCKLWNRRSQDARLWKQLVEEYIPNCIKPADISWKDYYKSNVYGVIIRDLHSSKNFFVTARNRTITLWSRQNAPNILPDKTENIETHHHKPITCCELYLAGMSHKFITGSSDNTICIYAKHSNTDPITLERTLEGHKGKITALKACESTIYSGSADKTIRIWSSNYLRTIFHCTQTLVGHEGTITCLQMGKRSPYGRILYSSAKDRTIRVWNIFNSGKYLCKQINEEHHNTITCMVADPNNHTLFSGSADKTIRIWDIEADGTLMPRQTLEAHSCAVTCLLKYPGEDLLFSGSLDNTIKIWKKGTDGDWKNIATLTGHKRAITAIRICYYIFGTTNKIIYSVSTDNEIRLWGTTGDALKYRYIFTIKGDK